MTTSISEYVVNLLDVRYSILPVSSGESSDHLINSLEGKHISKLFIQSRHVLLLNLPNKFFLSRMSITNLLLTTNFDIIP